MEQISFGQPQVKTKKRKQKQKPSSGFNIVDDDNEFRSQGRQQFEPSMKPNSRNIMVEGQGMITIDNKLLKTAEDDDIKPILVTDISAEKLQEILSHQNEEEIQKLRKKKMKHAKKEKKREAQWVQIDDEGNKVKAFIGNHALQSKFYVEDTEDK